MKTYEEMAQSVIHRAKAHRTARNRRIVAVAAAVLCVCGGIGLAAINANQPDVEEQIILQTDPTNGNGATEVSTAPSATDPTHGISTEATEFTEAPSVTDQIGEPSTSRVTFLCAAPDGSAAIDMRKDMELPYRMQIRLKDTRGLTDKEVRALREAEQKYADDLIAQYPDASDRWEWTQGGGKDTIITVISAGRIILRMEDPEQVERVHVALAGDGQMYYLPEAPDWEDGMPYEYQLSDKEIEGYSWYYDGIAMGWTLDSRLYHRINPDTPLSSFWDTITVTVTFKDGVVETHAIDVVIDDSGEISTIYRGQI